jgi:hypothetical protein
MKELGSPPTSTSGHGIIEDQRAVLDEQERGRRGDQDGRGRRTTLSLIIRVVGCGSGGAGREGRQGPTGAGGSCGPPQQRTYARQERNARTDPEERLRNYVRNAAGPACPGISQHSPHGGGGPTHGGADDGPDSAEAGRISRDADSISAETDRVSAEDSVDG